MIKTQTSIVSPGDVEVKIEFIATVDEWEGVSRCLNDGSSECWGMRELVNASLKGTRETLFAQGEVARDE